MRLKLNKKKYKYIPEYVKREDDLNVKLPSYTIYRKGEVLHEGEWKGCRFYISDKPTESIISVSSSGIVKKGISDIGKVDSQGNVDVIKLSKFQRLKIKIYDFVFFRRIVLYSFIDKVKLIRKNLKYILISLLGSIIYFLINHFFDGFLQDLINKSNLVQSFIVFLSLSSIINIFHPFTLRKEWTIKEIDVLILKRLKKAKSELEHEEWVKKNTSF